MNNSEYDIYEDLVLKRDAYNKEAGLTKIEYYKLFGDLILESWQMKLECIKLKKKIAFCQTATLRNLPVDLDEMERTAKREMTLYNMQMQEVIDDLDKAEAAEEASEYSVEQSGIIYGRVARLIHPELNTAVVENRELLDLWRKVVAAYNSNDDIELDKLELQIMKITGSMGMYDNKDHIPDNLEERIKRVEFDIKKIINYEPYTYKAILSSPDMIEATKDDMNQDIDEYCSMKETLEEELKTFLSDGGDVTDWLKA